MMSPYNVCPFIGQNPGTACAFQSAALPGQQFMPAQQFMPVQQFMPQYMQMPQYYPMQSPPGIYEDTDTGFPGPATASPGDPPPLLSNNPVTTTVALFKELTAYPNYGNPSRNADILYTGNRGSWTFESPAFLFVPGNLRAQLIIRAVLDDHVNVPVGRYSARITVNGSVVHDGRLPLEHGAPVGGIFINWRELPFNITNLRRVTRVTIENTSTAGTDDWVAFDWMQIRFLPR